MLLWDLVLEASLARTSGEVEVSLFLFFRRPFPTCLSSRVILYIYIYIYVYIYLNTLSISPHHIVVLI